MDRELTVTEAGSARQIQQSIDDLAAAGGGRVLLPAMDLVLDRGLALHSGIELVGQGSATVLRKGPGRIYPLSGYHNYGMCDVPLQSAAGLEPGMTVSVHDDKGRGFYETFATITWVEGNWVGLDHGLEADYRAADKPCLTTAYPLIFAHRAHDIAVRDLTLEGNSADNAEAMGGCRGAAVYFYQSRGIEVTGVRERDYDGEGLGFQICRDVIIRGCTFSSNTGNGLHPGAGSTNALFEDCDSHSNGNCGFFFCVRANHITVTGCRFTNNGTGVSIGTRDCHNLIESCTVEGNTRAGILVRSSPHPVEVHSCHVRGCTISGNAAAEGHGQVEIAAAAHDLFFEGNTISGGAGGDKPGFFIDPSVRSVCLQGNHIRDCAVEFSADAASLVDVAPAMECGYGNGGDTIYRHLPV
ncbi:MAG: right-handed parallel beta-helix repeat-containing protein [bacterium]|nr:right-handed parallel beta-helix repeat-containing protein [bacterium]